MKLLARGTLAGLVGTALMTAAMLPSKQVSMSPGKVAPRQITENLLNRLGVRRHLSRPAFEASWVALHFAYGTVSGVASALGQRAIGRERPLLAGPVFGTVLWAAGYCGWLPLVGLYPPPTRLPKRQVGAELIATHLVYGATTAQAHQAFRSEPESGGRVRTSSSRWPFSLGGRSKISAYVTHVGPSPPLDVKGRLRSPLSFTPR